MKSSLWSCPARPSKTWHRQSAKLWPDSMDRKVQGCFTTRKTKCDRLKIAFSLYRICLDSANRSSSVSHLITSPTVSGLDSPRIHTFHGLWISTKMSWRMVKTDRIPKVTLTDSLCRRLTTLKGWPSVFSRSFPQSTVKDLWAQLAVSMKTQWFRERMIKCLRQAGLNKRGQASEARNTQNSTNKDQRIYTTLVWWSTFSTTLEWAYSSATSWLISRALFSPVVFEVLLLQT